jgi:hypothetical protein
MTASNTVASAPILLWVLESHEHVAFRDEWQAWAREELDTIARGVGAAQ